MQPDFRAPLPLLGFHIASHGYFLPFTEVVPLDLVTEVLLSSLIQNLLGSLFNIHLLNKILLLLCQVYHLVDFVVIFRHLRILIDVIRPVRIFVVLL